MGQTYWLAFGITIWFVVRSIFAVSEPGDDQ